MRIVVLSASEKERLTSLQKYSDNSVERKRSLYLLLSNQGHSMKRKASIQTLAFTNASIQGVIWSELMRSNG